MCQVASVCRGLAQSVDLESLLVDWERDKKPTVIRFYLLKFSGIVHAIQPFLQLLYLWRESLYRVMAFSIFEQSVNP